MKNIYFWIFFTLLSVLLTVLVFMSPVLNYGGDIAEYHGITETILKSKTLALTPVAEENLKKYLQPSYYENPGYYVEGIDGNRYPVHFVWYSILALPVRLLLHTLSINELQTLRLTNVFIFISTLVVLLKFFVHHPLKRLVLVTTATLSPLIFYLTWPGPDMYYLSLLLIGVFAFFKKNYILSSILVALASWHSQPLMILAFFISIYTLILHFSKDKTPLQNLKENAMLILKLQIVAAILFVPIIYNLYFFGTWSPWTSLQDGWTILNGFGIHNISIQKWYEQFFDLNIGLFFYAPLLLITGLLFIGKYFKNRDVIFLTIAFLVTAFFYQTNPAWHYGTAGYGPTRHIMFFLPLLIVFMVFLIKPAVKYYALFGLFVLSQIPIILSNGFTTPKLENSFKNNPAATFVLSRWPQAYNPTPEIFVDRTNHIDIDYPTSAIYKEGEICKKAYIVKTDAQKLIDECGPISEKHLSFFDNQLLRKSNVSRKITTTEATLWPDTPSCVEGYNGPFKCIKNPEDMAKMTGIDHSNPRIKDMGNNVWRIEKGTPVTISVPPGYIAHYNSLEGVYIDF